MGLKGPYTEVGWGGVGVNEAEGPYTDVGWDGVKWAEGAICRDRMGWGEWG